MSYFWLLVVPHLLNQRVAAVLEIHCGVRDDSADAVFEIGVFRKILARAIRY